MTHSSLNKHTQARIFVLYLRAYVQSLYTSKRAVVSRQRYLSFSIQIAEIDQHFLSKMALKVVATTTILLGVLGLLVQSRTIEKLDEPQTDSTVSGFTYTKYWNPNVKMTAPSGILQNHDTLQNTSEWRLSFTPHWAEISQFITFPDASVLYSNTDLTISIFKSSGPFIAELGDSTFKLIIKATQKTINGQDTCQLQINVIPTQLALELNTSNLDEAGVAIQAVGGLVVDSISRILKKTLQNELPGLFSTIVEQNLSKRINMDAFCTELLASDKTHYPQPTF